MGATAGIDPDAGIGTFVTKLNAKMERAKATALTSARRFEMKRPSDFEDAMFVYLNEEVATPGIHAASDFGLGAATR